MAEKSEKTSFEVRQCGSAALRRLSAAGEIEVKPIVAMSEAKAKGQVSAKCSRLITTSAAR